MDRDAADRVVCIGSVADIVAARQQGRSLASALGFSSGDLTVIATAISEIARNILEYAGRGEIRLGLCQQEGRRGICIVACDKGPGIADLERALRPGYSTRNGLGLGLPGAQRLMDEFEIVSAAGNGTTVTMRKWAP